MSDHFMLEAFRVILKYGWVSLTCGLAVSIAIVIRGSRRLRQGSRIAALTAATLVLWFALIVGVEYGYHAWQQLPNPPEEAFSDTGGPFFILLVGWLPSYALLWTVHLILRLKQR